MLEPRIQTYTFENKVDLTSSEIIYTNLSLASIILPESSLRYYFDSHKLSELAESIRQYGILKPLIVRHSHLEGKYELVAGERRYQAAKEAGLMEVPVTIYHISDEEAITISITENLQREDLNPVEETEGIVTLLSIKLNKSSEEVISFLYQMNNKQKKKANHNVMVSQEEMLIQKTFQVLGQMKWDSFVSNRLPILNLPEDILEVLRSGKIAYTKAIAISSVKETQFRQALIEEAVSQNLSLAQIRKKIKEYKDRNSSVSPWEQKAKNTLKRLVKSRIWENPLKKQEVEQLLLRLEQIMSE